MAEKTAVIVLALTLSACDRPLDNTDNMSTGQRSGFVVKIDHGTGCEYLFANFSSGVGGQLVPRVSEDGRTVRGCRPFIPKPTPKKDDSND